MTVASGLLALLMLAAFGLLFHTILGLRDAAELTGRSESVLAAANRLERLVIDLETGQRGYIITRDKSFLQPWNAGLAAIPDQEATLRRLAAANPQQTARAETISRETSSYINDYAIPLVRAAEGGQSIDRLALRIPEDKLRVDALRTQFDLFDQEQRAIAAVREEHSIVAARDATIVAVATAAGSLALIFLFAGYLTMAFVRPVRRASLMAEELARGDLTVRMPETSVGEIRSLEHAFNAMAVSLETSSDRLAQIAEEQGALRRVATLVARGASPEEVFGAVAGELGRILGADHTVISRFEPDGGTTVIGSWKLREDDPERLPAAGSHWAFQRDGFEVRVQRAGRPVRITDFSTATGGIGAWARSQGIRSGVAGPVLVEGALWGVMIAFSTSGDPQPEGTEGRLLEFAELVGTAIANAESRAQLVTARARVVEASDETRRRIERDLHDGAQQRLVSLGLELRAVEAAIPKENAALRERLSSTVSGLSGVLEELQEISRGLHPAILSKAGLRPALKGLARRAAIPVDLDVQVEGRLGDRTEVTVYYLVSEAITNALKHAQASAIGVDVGVAGDTVWLIVHDDGAGGAEVGAGSGLIGLKDRVEALGGTLSVRSPIGRGTTLRADFPIRDV